MQHAALFVSWLAPLLPVPASSPHPFRGRIRTANRSDRILRRKNLPADERFTAGLYASGGAREIPVRDSPRLVVLYRSENSPGTARRRDSTLDNRHWRWQPSQDPHRWSSSSFATAGYPP